MMMLLTSSLCLMLVSNTLATFPGDCSNSASRQCLSYDEVVAVAPNRASSFKPAKAPCTLNIAPSFCYTAVSQFGASYGSCHPESTRPDCYGAACDTSSVPQHPSCASDQENYCTCPFKKDDIWHTMCLYCGQGALCQEVDGYTGVTSAMRTEIVDAHNLFRSRVASGLESLGNFTVGGGDNSGGNGYRQPKAANMRELSWDDELARVAQRWADQCNDTDHDKARGTDDFPSVGQNMGYVKTNSKTLPFNATRIIEKWYLEVADWSPIHLDSFRPAYPGHEAIGHFTQVAWAESYKVGCGYTQFRHADGKFHQFIVCNYGPAGNFLGNQVYQKTTGTPGNQCPGSVVNGLCV